MTDLIKALLVSAVAATLGATAAWSASAPRTFTYDLVHDFGAAPKNVVATDRALKRFNAEAQKRTRPRERSYPGYPGYYANASVQTRIVLTIPAGAFIYSWNKFVVGIRHLTIKGAGSGLNGGASTTLQNVNGTGPWYDELSIHPNYDYFGDIFYKSNDYGRFIQTAKAGATRVTLRSRPPDVSQFAIGRWVLIMSYSQQQYGYPPNMRYYDWAKVTAIDPVRGVISFDTPLRYTHRADRPYAGQLRERSSSSNPAGRTGPAAIVAIDTAQKPVAESVLFEKVHVLGNPNWKQKITQAPAENSDAWLLAGIIDGVMYDVRVDRAMGFTSIRNLTIMNSKWSYDEADKIIGKLTYQNCDVDISLNHAGELAWNVLGGRLGRTIIGAADTRITKGTLIDGMTWPEWSVGVQLDGANYSNTVTIDHARFVGNRNRGNTPIAGPQPAPHTITVDGRVVTLPHGPHSSLIRIKKDLETDGSPSERVVDNWGDGGAIMKNGRFIYGAKINTITGDDNYVYIDVNGAAFVAGDQVYAAKLQKLTVTNSSGSNTGFDWIINSVPWGENIPSVTWSANMGN